MNAQEREEQKAQYLRAIFDTVPIPAFIVDGDVTVLDFNTSAERYLGPEPALALHLLGGEALHCLNAEHNGCGRSELCRDCVIRRSVGNAMRGRLTWRELHKAEVRSERGTTQIDLLVTASVLPYTQPPRALVLLEDVTELVKLRQMTDRPAPRVPPLRQNATTVQRKNAPRV